MSLILEALRRSEAERRRAAPPSLLGDVGPARPARTSAWPMALGGLLLGGLLAAAAVWWWGVGRGAPVADMPPAIGTAAPAPPAYDVPIEPVPAAAYAKPPQAQTPISPAPRPAPEAAPPSPAREIQPLVPAPPAVEAMSTATIEPEAIATADTGLGPRDGDLRWSEGAGDGLPPLRVSMHVYADDPARRFAIVDGQRRREGETLQPGLMLLEIRRDGLRLGWQGRVLWIPR